MLQCLASTLRYFFQFYLKLQDSVLFCVFEEETRVLFFRRSALYTLKFAHIVVFLSQTLPEYDLTSLLRPGSTFLSIRDADIPAGAWLYDSSIDRIRLQLQVLQCITSWFENTILLEENIM